MAAKASLRYFLTIFHHLFNHATRRTTSPPPLSTSACVSVEGTNPFCKCRFAKSSLSDRKGPTLYDFSQCL
jgi:hypothetical protein